MTDVSRKEAEEILTIASKLITEHRADEHGDSFKMTAALWSDYLGIQISEEEFCICLALMKIARSKLGRKVKDHYVDGAAYMALAGSATLNKPEPAK